MSYDPFGDAPRPRRGGPARPISACLPTGYVARAALVLTEAHAAAGEPPPAPEPSASAPPICPRCGGCSYDVEGGGLCMAYASDPAPNSPADIGFVPPEEPVAIDPRIPKDILGFCRSCKRNVFWVKLNGKAHPVERGVDPKGNIALTLHTSDDTVSAERVEPGSRPKLHLSHFATCPQAKGWRTT
jgi:hypothetical protein